MNCVLCAPFRWLCGKISAGCAETDAAVRARLRAWDYAQANDWEVWDRDPEKDRMLEAYQLRAADPQAAFARLLMLAEQGSVWSMLNVAAYYEVGIGVEADPIRQEEWLRRAFEGGSEQALLRYAWICRQRGDFARCEELYAVGAARDWAPALYGLAWYRLRRSKSRETLDEVRSLLERAVAKGSLAAQRHLARLMLKGSYGLRHIPEGLILAIDTIKKTTALLEEDTTTEERPSSPEASAMALPAE
jgi:TPR repeat protein